MSANRLQVVGEKFGDEELRLWLESFIKQYPHLTTAVLSRGDHIGLSRTALDQVLEGTYFLPKGSGGSGVNPKTSSVERKIRAYRDKVEGAASGGTKIGFVETVAYQRLCMAWDLAVEQRVVVLAYSDPGAGKSHPLEMLLRARMTTRPISILCSRNVTTGYFVQRLAEEVHLSTHHSIPRLEDMVADKLKKSPCGIVVDQANYLSERSLGTICHIWERARVPIMLVGTEELHLRFTTSDMTQDVRAQLTSRVAFVVPLSKLTKQEAKTVLQRALGSDATDANVAKIMEVTGGVFRSVTFIIPQIKRLKKTEKNQSKLRTGEITMEDIIVSAASRLIA